MAEYPTYYIAAAAEFQNCTDALEEAIRDTVRPSRLAQFIYRYATGCMALGKCKLALDLGENGIAQDEGRKAKSDFAVVQQRVASLKLV